MGLLSGLGGMGLGNLEGMSLYEDPKKPEKKEEVLEEAPQVKQVKEEDFLFEKSYTCPVCCNEFKSLSVRAGKTKLAGTDLDLRPRYDVIEPLKYDVVMCFKCGCTSLAKYWGPLSPTQRKNLIDMVCRQYKPTRNSGMAIYTYDEAIERYQMALANAIVRNAKASEKAYICLKAGWLVRTKIENLDETEEDYEKIKAESEALEEEFLKNALEGFIAARSKEMLPMCGMDENTLDYLIAALSYELKEYEQASKIIGKLLVSKTINARIKEKAIDLKDKVRSEMN